MSRDVFVRRELQPALPPPVSVSGPFGWLRTRLFAGPLSTVLTLASLAALWLIVPPLVRFLLIDAVWSGEGREACLGETVGRPVGACWPFITAKLGQLIYGFYPAGERWRVDLVFATALALLVPLLIPPAPFKRLNAALFFVVFPVAAYVLLVGGWFGLAVVETRAWGGLLVTLVVAVTGIVASLPLGILLALGRRSDLPAVRWLSVAFIEFWRGVPLITVLFFATYMLPLFLPGSWSIDNLLRALIGVAVFAAAYMAEVVRGGLQGVPRAQYEGATALGLRPWQTMALVVLPQALRLVIPGIVNTFIGLFKDTTLVMIVAIFDLLGQLRAAFADPSWASPSTLYTGFAFAGLIYFAFCFGMSRYAQFIERRLKAGR
ncbi:amino acid ABC transporter permease [Blastochloris tepida]|uniref:Amino acid ABC transporter permease n=1 Tax=Blastochloris tepida TaxID=2233851 RepID=A0A348FZL0_9HYPH|nr:amino acid ABC transporter permease [Blastochloris tepida]BBF92743.1 amino acid ABC transporter permease [Blastochloris tepida]